MNIPVGYLLDANYFIQLWDGWRVAIGWRLGALPPGKDQAITPAQFRALFGGNIFLMDLNGATTTDAWKAFTENQSVRFPRVNVTAAGIVTPLEGP